MARAKHPTDENSFRGDTKEEETPIENPVQERSSHYKVHSNEKVTPMPMLDPSEWGMNEAVEPYALDDASEARLQIVEAQLRSSDTGQYVMVRFEVEGEPYAKTITRIVGIPDREKQTPKQFNDAGHYMRLFLQCFDIDSTGPMMPSDDWPGHSGWCILSKIDDPQYGEQNKISKMIAPR